ncbi:hypothetical protein RHMOL_Rhmol06G0074300 [Rhododendron molle]|uniref:Uncharacterized protein n=1 Tax=Rhododendron molle TaxID=49168 RepID=A0ACC0NBF7_RHOML|nr:hypothetical protein RHMOL_Rhmol06G0074300 [Rhododendron molle]
MALHAFITNAMGMFRLYLFIMSTSRRPQPRPELSPNPNFYQTHVNNINRLVRGNDTDCHEQLRVNRHTFLRLCFLVRGVGLGDSRNVCLEERVAIFLWVLGHHTKQRRTKYDFWRSIETVSRHFNAVLLAVLRLYNMLLVTPEPVPPNYEDSRWSWFQNCLGALDGTYVPVNPPAADRPRYRSRKGEIATNVLGVCSRDQKFVYVLSGWEGSATDSRILQNAIEIADGLIVPHGHYYLVDAGYTNGNGFLAPYRGQRREMPNDPIEQEYAAWERDHVNDVPDDDHIAMDNEVEEVEAPTKGKRRNWSSTEEDALMKCVVNELVGEKWRAENGFRGGFFNHVEKELQKFLSGTTLKANPHIDSKVKYWKVTWAKIVDIIGLSGFGWDDVNKRIVVEKDVWENYEKAHPKKAKNLYGKTFPYFDDWQFMFGKHRATGAGVETPASMGRASNASQSLPTFNDCYIPQFGEEYGAFQNDSPMSPATPTTPTTPIPQTFTPHSSLPTSTPQTSVPQPNAGGTKRKRTRMGDEELSMFASMKNWMDSSDGHMEKMVNCFGYDKELSARRTQVPDELSKLDITLLDKFKLGAVICQEEQRVDNFYGIKPEERQAYVEAILSGVVYGPI